MKFEITVTNDRQWGKMISIIGPGLEYRKDDEGRGINCTGLGMTNDDEFVLSECGTIASAIRNIIEIRNIKEGL